MSSSSTALDGSDCAICCCNALADALDDSEGVGRLSRCTHAFCFPCITAWAKKAHTCPICRDDFHEIIRLRRDAMAQKISEEPVPTPRVEAAEEEGDSSWLHRCIFCGQVENPGGVPMLTCACCSLRLHPACARAAQREVPDAQDTEWMCEVCLEYNVACMVCGQLDCSESGPGAMLLCDGCDRGVHCRCCGIDGPPASETWFCAECDHTARASPYVAAASARPSASSPAPAGAARQWQAPAAPSTPSTSSREGAPGSSRAAEQRRAREAFHRAIRGGPSGVAVRPLVLGEPESRRANEALCEAALARVEEERRRERDAEAAAEERRQAKRRKEERAAGETEAKRIRREQDNGQFWQMVRAEPRVVRRARHSLQRQPHEQRRRALLLAVRMQRQQARRGTCPAPSGKALVPPPPAILAPATPAPATPAHVARAAVGTAPAAGARTAPVPVLGSGVRQRPAVLRRTLLTSARPTPLAGAVALAGARAAAGAAGASHAASLLVVYEEEVSKATSRLGRAMCVLVKQQMRAWFDRQKLDGMTRYKVRHGARREAEKLLAGNGAPMRSR
jgi:hypothetical protein